MRSRKANAVWNLFDTKLDNSWMLVPVLREMARYEKSVKEYPNIAPGEDFKGYPKK